MLIFLKEKKERKEMKMHQRNIKKHSLKFLFIRERIKKTISTFTNQD